VHCSIVRKEVRKYQGKKLRDCACFLALQRLFGAQDGRPGKSGPYEITLAASSFLMKPSFVWGGKLAQILTYFIVTLNVHISTRLLF